MKRALLSVSDKQGIVSFASRLKELGWEVIATGGTRKLLSDNGVETVEVSSVTGFPEILDGRVKTLHPKVHGGILARRDIPSHVETLNNLGIGMIDLVCVNLYPFRETVSKEGVSMEEAVENIDIGGPSMLRSAAKNWRDVTVVCDPNDYPVVLSEIETQGDTTSETRLRLSAKAYTHTAEYDMCIADYMRGKAGLPKKLFLEYDAKQSLRYGENPHQKAAFYSALQYSSFSLPFAEQIQGKELSYNNIQDANAALSVLRDFDEPFCVALKHMNPCGAAMGNTIYEAWKAAFEADKVSIYGGIVALNRELSAEIALEMKPIFLEIVIAPSFSPEALEVLSKKKNLRVLKVDMDKSKAPTTQYLGVNGGMLVQDADTSVERVSADMCVGKVPIDGPDAESLLRDADFGWRIVKHVKSNAIVVVKDGHTVGVGAGQTNRVGSAHIALEQARSAGFSSRLVLASDGFLPFDDTVSLAAEYGVEVIVQPGGSIRDAEAVAKADEEGISMLFTGVRHFKH